MNLYKLILPLIAALIFLHPLLGQQSFSDHGMHVEWSFSDDSITFKIESPTSGWQAIGFNSTSELTGTYLMLSRIINGKAEVIEHYVFAPGRYTSISELGKTQRAEVHKSYQEETKTHIEFSLPRASSHSYTKAFEEGKDMIIHYAYSLSTDFEHHSIYRSLRHIIL
jgi:hypothetical protein